MLLLGEAPLLSAALQAALTERACRVRHILPGKRTRALGQDRFEVDLDAPEAIRALHDLLTRSGSLVVGAVLNLRGLETTAGETPDERLGEARRLFFLLQTLESDLRESATHGGGWLINFTAIDGQFGLRGGRDAPLGTAGTLGIAKSVAREWPHVRVKCLDLEPHMDANMLMAQVLEELFTRDPELEVGLTATGRRVLTLQEAGLPTTAWPEVEFGHRPVFLVTGGAYGITAEVTTALAARCRQPHLILVGRSSPQHPEPPGLEHLREPQAMRRFLIEHMRATHDGVTPAIVEHELQQILKTRQIRANLAAMHQAGATLEYHTLDVRDTAAFGRLLDTVYATWGRIDGVLHGAGVVDDRRISDKTPSSFDAVFDTKVLPATVLAAKLRPETLTFLLLFSSVVGRFGNAGQSDYSAANEGLNKLAARLGRAWPQVRVTSINWGPWAGGMVSDAIQAQYARQGIRLIPPDVGVRFCLEALQREATGVSEVVITASLDQFAARLPSAARRN